MAKAKHAHAFHNDYTVIDTETTGLYKGFDEIIEIAAMKIKQNEVINTFSSLVKPENEIPPFITELTGITDGMVAEAPRIAKVLPQFLEFVGDSTVVGHNVHFDIGFINDYAKFLGMSKFDPAYTDTLYMSRRLLPDLECHKLGYLTEALRVDIVGYHRALNDCRITNDVYQKLRCLATEENIDVSSFNTNISKNISKYITADGLSLDTEHPLYGKDCVFTGPLQKMTRRMAMQLVANIGARPADNINKRTDVLILGDTDYMTKDGKSNKRKRAETLMLKGVEIEIIPESVFYELMGIQ